MTRARILLAATALFTGHALLAAGRPASAQPGAPLSSRPSMLVSTAWLASHQGDGDLVVLHVGRRAQYDSAHIPGARSVTLGDVSLPSGPGVLSLQLPSVDQLVAWAERNGIGSSTRIIVVAHDDTLQSATRVFLTLAYLGAFEHTSLLDGGLVAWRAEGRPVSNVAAAPATPAHFTPRLHAELIATMSDVEHAIEDKQVSLVDARLPRFYNGDGGGFPRPGHIPSAVNVPFATMSEQGKLKEPAQLRALFADAGVVKGKRVVAYCHIGQQASLLWFVATLLGYEARLYDGSFQEWSGTERLPVVPPAAKTPG